MKISWFGVYLSALVVFFPTLTNAADQPRWLEAAQKVRIAYSAISASQLVGWGHKT